jgi:hypothetical protein
LFAHAVRVKNNDMINYLVMIDCPRATSACNVAAYMGDLEMMKFLRSDTSSSFPRRAARIPCPWSAKTCTLAASAGNIEMLQWLRAQNPPCPWNEESCHAAIKCKKFNMLKWLRAQTPPCPLDVEASRIAIQCKAYGLLEWMREQGAPWNLSLLEYAIEEGDYKAVITLRETTPQCPGFEQACTLAAKYGRREILVYLRGSQYPPCPWDEKTCAAAAATGDLVMLRWLRAEHSYKFDLWDETDGKVRVWPRCPWDETTLLAAAHHQHFNVLNWLGEHFTYGKWCEFIEKASPLVQPLVKLWLDEYLHRATWANAVFDPIPESQEDPEFLEIPFLEESQKACPKG